MTRFSPRWWALWTWELTRPGLLDDEEPPEEAPQSGVWAHYPDGLTLDARPVWDARSGQNDDPAGLGVSPYDPRARRPSWPAILAEQESDEPAETGNCLLHDGRCSGWCER